MRYTVHGGFIVDGRSDLLGSRTGNQIKRNGQSESGVRRNIVQRRLGAHPIVYRFKLSRNVNI